MTHASLRNLASCGGSSYREYWFTHRQNLPTSPGGANWLDRGSRLAVPQRPSGTKISRRRSLWIDATIPLMFAFENENPIKLNPAWVDALMMSANSMHGLQIVPEPATARATDPVPNP